MLGRDLVDHFSPLAEVTSVDLEDFDIADAEITTTAIADLAPEIVLHTAAFTNVDACETERETALRSNAQGAGNVALACRKIGARMVLYSTDYVFDGTKAKPYTEQDITNPRTVYGLGKLEAERAVGHLLDNHVSVLRIAWLYGRHGHNFVKTMLRLGRDRLADATDKPLLVVDDQTGSPTWTCEVARQTEIVIERKLTGVKHATAGGSCSWYRFAQEIFKLAGMEVPLEPCSTDRFPRPARRPKMSVLENMRLKAANCDIMRPWDVALKEFWDENGKRIIDEL